MHLINIWVGKYFFQTFKKSININDVDINKIALFNKASYGEQGPYKYYVGYLSDLFRPLHIIIKETKLYTNYGNTLADNIDFLKDIEIFSKIKDLFNEKFNKRGYSKNLMHNKEYIKPKISPFNKNFHGNKKFIKNKYYGNSVLLIEFICEIKNKYYVSTFLNEFFKT